jgi:PAS domain S-box-containing protein
MVKSLYSTLLLLTIFVCNTIAYSQVYTFRNFSHKEGLDISSFLSAEEDDLGYLWFGSNGAGLVRYDGEEFDYLDHIQGRSRRHISDLTFDEASNPILSTQYRGVYQWKNQKESKLRYIEQIGKAQGVDFSNDKLTVIHDASLQLFRDSNLIAERKLYPLNEVLHLFGKYKVFDNLFVFTSRGNFVVNNDRIENLSDWLGTSEEVTNDLVGLIQSGDSLRFINKTFEHELTVLVENYRPKFFVKEKFSDLSLEEGEEVLHGAAKGSVGFFITNKNRLFKWSSGIVLPKFIVNNSDKPIQSPSDILIDRNSDVWITTLRDGIFKISLEPFTPVQLSPVYQHEGIMFTQKTAKNDIIISNIDRKTYISYLYTDTAFDEYDFFTKTYTNFKGIDLIGTSQGIYEATNSKLFLSRFSQFNDKNISLLFGDEYLYVAEDGVGLFRYDDQSNSVDTIKGMPAYIYTAEHSYDNKKIYFGTNLGVFEYNKSTSQVSKITNKINGFDYGFYSGNSTIDIYETRWFSLDEGIIGIKKDGSLIGINESQFLPSHLIYTLVADNNGNLIVGSNKGITVISLNENSLPNVAQNFNADNGFGGYETHMRSDYKNEEGHIYVGTMDGLYLIRPQFFEVDQVPPRPIISKVASNIGLENLLNTGKTNFHNDENSLYFNFKSINVKSNQVHYSYRIVGFNDNWSEPSEKTEAYFKDLPGGEYTFEVRSTLDGSQFSDSSKFSFEVHIPFYRSKWFILSGIALVIIINFYILEKTKRFNRQNIILSQDLSTSKKTATSLLLFGGGANLAAHVFTSMFFDDIVTHLPSVLVIAAIVFTLFLLLTFVNFFEQYSSQILMTGFMLILGHNLFASYYSSLHPFYLTAILITLSVTPVIFRSLKAVILLAIFLVVSSFVISTWIQSGLYDSYLFTIAIAVSSILAVLLTYIRNNSLEKLIFTSGVLNKGNALVLAFDNAGKITYASENISTVIDVDSSGLVGTEIAELNRYQPESAEKTQFNRVDLKNEFAEGKIFVTPLFTANNDLLYYQWSCKKFSDDVRVILGQDVTEKINLESYYELIVNNADDLIYQTDALGNFKFLNQKCISSFKYKESELLGATFETVIHPDHLSRVRRFYRTQFKSKDKNSYLEFKIITGEGEERWLGQNVTTLVKPGTEGFVTGFLGLARDITERRRANLIIQEQNRDIKASINYARRIQFNMLPRSITFEELFKEHFVLFRPKDIVSGDFYWLEEVDEKIILVCSDCTGHGVPGAFMTLLGIDILNQIVKEGGETDPGKVLDKLDHRLKAVLPRDGRNRIQDGMELVVCVFDKCSNNIEYATAGGRFAVLDEECQNLEIYKSDNKHIGDIAVEDDFSYATKSMQLEPYETLYLFSDGYPDQFGGDKNKKLTFKKFQSLIHGIGAQPLSEQNEILREHLKEWIGSRDQTDDITVIGIRGVQS